MQGPGWLDIGPDVLIQVSGWCDAGPWMLRCRSLDVQFFYTETASKKVEALLEKICIIC